jgi:hypothetical protein
MDYWVIGEDGAEYGPASLETIAGWVVEGRVQPSTKLKSFQTSIIAEAGTF